MAKQDLTALQLSDEELDRLAEITEDDIRQTQILWQALAPAWAKNLLAAEPTGSTPRGLNIA